MYSVGGWHEYEWEYEMSFGWRVVGRYLRFTREVEALAEVYLRRTFGLGEGESVPQVSWLWLCGGWRDGTLILRRGLVC